jgi:type I restriction enzyme S subunit
MAMSKQYSCDLCKKVFNQKIDFTRHQNKKAPCITLSEMQQISKTKEVKMDNKTTLISVFKSCLNILRDNEGLTGEKALRTLSYLLILKLLEPHFGGEINIDDYEYDFSHIEDEMIEKHKIKLLEIVRFSSLSNEKEDNIPVNMKYLWDDILSNHPTTKNIFLKGKGFDIQHKSTYKKLIDKLNLLDLSKTEYDVLGSAYEEVIQDIMTGKVFGQFFTQPLVKKMMVKLINPQIHPDGKIDTCGDPTMGTGGFLITYLQYILQQANAKNIKPDWDFIKTEGLYGKELEPDTYQLAVSNMLISSGHMFEKLDRGDSIRVPITRKFDNILANPPFGIDGLIYSEILDPLRNEYMPIKSNSAVPLFLQAIIYMLNINGKCAIVLPCGEDLSSKKTKSLVVVREYLMKTCDLKEINYLPSGVFTHTNIKTCVLYFVKKREGSETLETKIQYSDVNQKETDRQYVFSKTHQTTKVKFYDYNPYEDVKNLLIEVPIEKIMCNSYSLSYAEYMKDETEEEQYEEGVVVKTLGEVCKFLPKSKRNAKYGNKEGIYPFFKSSIKVDSYIDEPDYEEESLIIGDGGEPNINYGVKFSTSDHCYILQNKIKLLLNLKYVYYYLYHNLDMMKQLYIGAGIKNISKTNIEGIKIPIPSLDKQQEIVKYLDFIYEKANKTSNEKIAELKQLNEFCLNNQKIFGENVVKEFKDLCDMSVKGNTNSKEISNTGEYPFYKASVSNPSGTHNTFCFDDIEYLLFIKSGGNSSKPLSLSHGIGKVYLVNGKSSGNTEVVKIKNNELVMLKYLYYYLQNEQLNIQKLAKYSTNLGHIDMNRFKEFKIHIPSIERQKEIVEYCEYNDTLIKQLEKEIENNKLLAKQFITGIVKIQVQIEEEHVDISSANNIASLNVIEPVDNIQEDTEIYDEEFVIKVKPNIKKSKKSLKTEKIIEA